MYAVIYLVSSNILQTSSSNILELNLLHTLQGA